MKTILYSMILFITISSCKEKTVSPYENGFIGHWKFVSVTDNGTGTAQTKPDSLGEVVTTFAENLNRIEALAGGLGCYGTYSLSENNGITITDMHRGDFSPAPNGVWLDLYLDVMNKAQSYQLNGGMLTIQTNDGRTILLTKM